MPVAQPQHALTFARECCFRLSKRIRVQRGTPMTAIVTMAMVTTKATTKPGTGTTGA
jgi:hypothetical protein